MKKILSPEEKYEKMFENGMNSYEHEKVVKECWKAIKESKKRKQEEKEKQEYEKRFKTIKLFK